MLRIALSFAIWLVMTGASHAETRRYDLRVAAMALGSRVFEIDVSASIGPSSYLVEASLKTAGIVDSVARNEGLFRSLGSVDLNGLNPERALVRSIGGSGERRAELAWDAFGLALVDVEPPPREENRDPVPVELKRGTHDLATAVLERLIAREGVDPCSGTLRVFDGRRRYDLHLHWGPDDVLKPHRLSAYAGPARRCIAHHERIAGYQRDFEERNRGRPPAVYTAWLVRTPDNRMLMPVRLRSETWFGGFTAYVLRARVDGATVFDAPNKAD